MQPIVTDRVAWSVSLSVCHSNEPCKNGWTDRDAIWVFGLDGPKESYIRWGSRSTYCNGATLWGKGSPF